MDVYPKDGEEELASRATIETISSLVGGRYKYGFVSDVEAETAPKGLNEEIIRFISAKKQESNWLLEWRLKAYRHWLTMPEPTWANVSFAPIDYQDAHYYSAPRSRAGSGDGEIDPELKRTYDKLGIPLQEQQILAGV